MSNVWWEIDQATGRDLWVNISTNIDRRIVEFIWDEIVHDQSPMPVHIRLNIKRFLRDFFQSNNFDSMSIKKG